MGLSALSLLTHGWHHPGLVEVEVCEAPFVPAVVEVRPVIRSVDTPPSPTGAEAPVVISAEELRPEMRGATTPQTTAGDEPTVVSTEEIKPIITSVKED